MGPPATRHGDPPAVRARIDRCFDSSFCVVVRSTFYYAGETHSDPDTDAGRSATGVPLRPATATQSGVCAVDPTAIPYGSRVFVQTAAGPRCYLAADTGGAVRLRTASGGTGLVIDFYSEHQVGSEWQPVTIVPYRGGTPFARLPRAAKLAALELHPDRE